MQDTELDERSASKKYRRKAGSGNSFIVLTSAKYDGFALNDQKG